MKLFRGITKNVYAGPDFFNKKNAEMKDVYAGPDMMGDEEERKTELETEKLPTYPAQYEADKKDEDMREMKLVYAAPGPEAFGSSETIMEEDNDRRSIRLDDPIICAVYAGPEQMRGIYNKENPMGIKGTEPTPAKVKPVPIEITGDRVCPECGCKETGTGRFCPECGKLLEVKA